MNKQKNLKFILVSFFFLCVFLCSMSANAKFPQDFEGVVWLHQNVSSWEQSGTLRSVSSTNGALFFDFDKTNIWPGVTITSSWGAPIQVNANPWVFVKKNNVWYAAIFEWLAVGQTLKPERTVNGDHIYIDPLGTYSPKQGEEVGFMISGLALLGARNVPERTNVVLFKWGVGMVPFITLPSSTYLPHLSLLSKSKIDKNK